MALLRFESAAYERSDEFVYGRAKKPVALKNGMVIGGGTLYPEINFTLPPMPVNADTMPDILRQYREITEDICRRAEALRVPGFVVEIETLPPMTFHPDWGTEVCKTVLDAVREHEAKHGIKGAVRITPNDIREGKDLEHMHRGRHWEAVLRTFEQCAEAGADLLAIESVGGKEVHDEAVMYCDLKKALFALAVPGCRDMEKLWTEIVRIGERTGAVPSGDTACGFANTAMVLADKKYIPKTFAAVIRVMSAVRSLTAAECGARGPHKDCGYEGVYVKAVAGTPISMEGRTAACAHFSSVGNVAICAADLWSNESVQNIKLLSGPAPIVSFEQLAYDCRLMNEGRRRGEDTALLLRDLHADSDCALDPQAYVLHPEVVLRISRELAKIPDRYRRMVAAARLAVEEMRSAANEGRLKTDARERERLDLLAREIEALPADEEALTAEVADDCENFDPKKYDL